MPRILPVCIICFAFLATLLTAFAQAQEKQTAER